ncbi:MAG: GNAT family N-acetyltransferase [Flavobacteriales bacterium]|nr:GNAT family N-acetyltransferase [Flavobacteriales bacterium]
MAQRRISIDDAALLRSFLDGAGDSLKTFRYFDARPFDVLKNHLSTWLWIDGGSPVAYGHLDVEDGTVWLGIAVQQKHWGKGFGAWMMKLLLDSARACGVQRIKLSVDNDNASAIALYTRYGFVLDLRNERNSFYTCDLSPKREAVMSSLAFMGMGVEEMIKIADREFMALEFSSGMPFHDSMEHIFHEAPMRRFAHNYFPAPKVPFVLNLGSTNEENRRRSIDHCVRGIAMSHAVGAPFFSAHSGFCVDPKPSELGRKLEQIQHIDREANWSHFIASVHEVLSLTRDFPTGFLLENNVLAQVNRYADGTNPLLCVEASEQLRLISEVKDPRVGLLFDTAHMKVSAKTLGFDLASSTKELLPHVRCVHHSDNDGLVDDNRPFDAGYWFLPFMHHAKHAVHVLETKKCSAAELRRMGSLLFNAASSS